MPSKDIDCSVSYVPVCQTGYFSNLVTDYLQQNEALKPFYTFELSDDGLKNAIEERRKFPVNRTLLQAVIKEQYNGLDILPAVDKNIQLLSLDNTFTVCSAHQPNLMTGYLYFIYKIIHSAKLADHLKSLSSNDNFVPVFYIGSEDNDLEELGHFRFAKQMFTWATQQEGAVGMMEVDASLIQLIKSLLPLLGPTGEAEKKLKQTILKAYDVNNTIAQATRILINELLGQFGIVVLDANDKRLKQSFAPIIKQEILNPKAYQLVHDHSEQLNQKYKVQAFYRPINFFYLEKGLRERIENIDNQYIVVNKNLKFSKQEIENSIDNYPEKFSPNVILRGLYQESILPNIAFIGGGSEVAYWMQLASVFKHYQVFYPVIILRQSAIVIDHKTNENKIKIGLDDNDMFLKTKTLIDNIVLKEKENNWEITNYTEQLKNWKRDLENKLSNLDKMLINSVNSTISKAEYQFDILDKKINRAIKSKLDIQIDRVYLFKDHAFPNDSLQERYETFMPFYLNYGEQFFDDLYRNTDPFGKQFLILKYLQKD